MSAAVRVEQMLELEAALDSFLDVWVRSRDITPVEATVAYLDVAVELARASGCSIEEFRTCVEIHWQAQDRRERARKEAAS
jgi:hypothetical protein